MLKKLNSLLLYVSDVNASAKFYQDLGFTITKETQEMCIAKLGDFELHCHDQDSVRFKEESKIKPKGGGVFIYVAVENIDDYYKSLIDKGVNPSSKPRDWDWGNREFVIRDPDGYKIVFYQKLSA